ncbi:MAG: FAD-binding oxidoreductase, partial [Verrucomicrobiia bacterium]
MKKRKTFAKATKELREQLGSRKVLLEGDRKFMASFDSSKLSFEYDALIRARADADVGIVLKLANAHNVP